TALLSALSNVEANHDVAMTGEITLRGRVLPIGGLREKTMAAYRNKIKTVIIPAANLSDLDEVDSVVKNAIKFIPVKSVEEVFPIALSRVPAGESEETIAASLLSESKTGSRVPVTC
ncbi:MAG: endopeptidase La, partial [Oscillospiraceae bacterium]|nr:endopeptidase La [Oscillospiraceae bacterium]MBP1556539.1 endopeptidase La [Oscillospiraceae bacterium]